MQALSAVRIGGIAVNVVGVKQLFDSPVKVVQGYRDFLISVHLVAYRCRDQRRAAPVVYDLARPGNQGVTVVV